VLHAERVYALGLQAAVLPPQFEPPDAPGNELAEEEEDDSEEDELTPCVGGGGNAILVGNDEGAGGGDEDGCTQIDWEGLSSRLTCLPLPPGEYGCIVPMPDANIMYLRYLTDEQHLAVLRESAGNSGGGGAASSSDDDEEGLNLADLMQLSLRTGRTSVLVENVQSTFSVSFDKLAMAMLVFEDADEVCFSVDAHARLRARVAQRGTCHSHQQHTLKAACGSHNSNSIYACLVAK
jgi:hypothetical protein